VHRALAAAVSTPVSPPVVGTIVVAVVVVSAAPVPVLVLSPSPPPASPQALAGTTAHANLSILGC